VDEKIRELKSQPLPGEKRFKVPPMTRVEEEPQYEPNQQPESQTLQEFVDQLLRRDGDYYTDDFQNEQNGTPIWEGDAQTHTTRQHHRQSNNVVEQKRAKSSSKRESNRYGKRSSRDRPVPRYKSDCLVIKLAKIVLGGR